MKANQAVDTLIRQHGEELRINRAQLASEAGIKSPGQLSNWLLHEAHLGNSSRGKVVSVMIDRTRELLKREPTHPDTARLRQILYTLENYGPLARMHAEVADPS